VSTCLLLSADSVLAGGMNGPCLAVGGPGLIADLGEDSLQTDSQSVQDRIALSNPPQLKLYDKGIVTVNACEGIQGEA
jgi:hypothetical protein